MSDELDINYEEPALLPDNLEEAQRRVEWHARMVRHYQSQLDREVGAFKREIERLRGEIAARTKTAQAHIEWHEAPIRSYHMLLHDIDPDMRTLRLPHATSKITVPRKPKVDIDTDVADYDVQAVNWMYDHHPGGISVPGISTIRLCVDVKETDDGYVVVDTDTGEVLPFLKAAVPDPTYKLTPEEGAPL